MFKQYQVNPLRVEILLNGSTTGPPGDDREANLTMTLTNARGDSRVRKIKQFSAVYGGVEKKIMFFISPADVRNTSFMSWSYTETDNDDDQWIYLPALQRVKRISSDSKNDAFMGSDFTYDDLGDRKPSEDTHRLVREEMRQGEMCYVVESIPVDRDELTSRTVSWISKDKWVGIRKEFYDHSDKMWKVLTIDAIQNINGFWVITQMTMSSLQKKHKTTMSLSDVRINEGLPERQFSERMMRRGL